MLNRQCCRRDTVPAGAAYPLSFCKPGQEVTVHSVTGKCNARSRLETLGFVPGAKITVVSANHRGPFIVRIKDSQLAIGRGMSHKILVG
ncbi:MAG: ferrous iron transport protein A [Candidatus Cloacimonetes bacterium]|nr:ferrous iron transport protein A [Candidatus Cloacimonadota bacterium]